MAGSVELSIEDAVKAAIDLHKRGYLSEASIIYDEILEIAPESADALHYKGLIQHQLGESEIAIELIRRALKLAPVYPDALNNLGNILRESGHLEDARDCYRQVLEVAPRHVDTLVNMADVLNGMHQAPEAHEYLNKAMAIDPEHAVLWHTLGKVYRERQMYDESKYAFEKSIELAPENTEPLKEIAQILYRSGKQKESVETLQRVLKNSPDDELAKHMIASFGGSQVPDRAPDRYVAQTFDEFATRFDESLARLEYKAPQLVGEELKRLLGQARRKPGVLDIGCGTGLCGPIVKPIAAALTGVDLSSAMLRRAKRRNVYDKLHEAELTEFMQKSAVTYDAIICVDTFVYFGKLDAAFSAAEAILNSGGYLIFTVERHTSDECADDFRLQHHGRYSHIDDYLERVLKASGLTVQSLTSVVLRMERGAPVNGMLVVARKSNE
jgi:predicted TPR repeat methyltransferase